MYTYIRTYICMYVCIYTCTRTYVHTYMYICIYIHIHICMYACDTYSIPAQTRSHVHSRAQIQTPTETNIKTEQKVKDQSSKHGYQHKEICTCMSLLLSPSTQAKAGTKVVCAPRTSVWLSSSAPSSRQTVLACAGRSRASVLVATLDPTLCPNTPWRAPPLAARPVTGYTDPLLFLFEWTHIYYDYNQGLVPWQLLCLGRSKVRSAS